jgi:hypothetical protein
MSVGSARQEIRPDEWKGRLLLLFTFGASLILTVQLSMEEGSRLLLQRIYLFF